MIREEIREDAGVHFIGKTDAQILRELAASWGHRVVARPGEEFERQDEMAATPDDDGVTEVQHAGLLA
jgi:hypothetical protein